MAEAVAVQRARYIKAPRPSTRRASAYKKVRDEGVGAKKYETKISPELVDELIDTAFTDLEALDRIVTEILNRHGIYGNARIAYRNYARQLYAFGRKYGKIPPDYVSALRREKEIKGATSLDVNKEIEDAVALFLGIAPISTQAAAQQRGAAGGGGTISLGP